VWPQVLHSPINTSLNNTSFTHIHSPKQRTTKIMMSPCHVILSIVLLVCTTTLSLSQSTPQDFLEVHNQARAEVGVGPMSWNHTLEAYAQSYANGRIPECKLEHSMGPYGENLAEGYGTKGSDYVKYWLTEKPNYDPGSNSCVHGECRHYAQIVCRNCIHLGCAIVKCNNNGLMFVICSYSPPGN